MPPYQLLNASEILELYFIENRARLLDIAAFLDRIDRYPGAAEAREDFRYQALLQAAEQLSRVEGKRTVAIQQLFSDPTSEPLASAIGLRAVGAWDKVER